MRCPSLVGAVLLLACGGAPAEVPVEATKVEATKVEAKVEAKAETKAEAKAEATKAEATKVEAKAEAADVGPPKTLEAARDRLQRLATAGDTAGLLALADPAKGLEHVYTGEGKRQRAKIALDKPDKFVATLSGGKFRPTHYIGAFFSEMAADARSGELKISARPGVIEGVSAGSYGVDFVFEKVGEAFALVRIETWDEEP